MNRVILYITIGLFVLTSCDFLKIESEDRLPGDEFWIEGNSSQTEGFLMSTYFNFRKATMGNSQFLTASGDMRCAPIIPINSNNNRINHLVANRMNDLRNYGGNPFGETTKWKPFYDVIQPANILVEEIGNVPNLTTEELNRFTAEAVFMRNLSYFFLVRAFGDIPYYTEAYNSESLPRTPMVEVLQNCLEDLRTGALGTDANNYLLPWSYSSNAKKGIRATRGSVIALMMHINLWLARFDNENKGRYYQEVVNLGEMLEQHGGAYQLLDITRTSTIFAGASDEALFEIAQNINHANEVFSEWAVFSNNVAYKYRSDSNPEFYYDGKYIDKIYPAGEDDLRKIYWFDENMYKDPDMVLMDNPEIIKFLNVDHYSESSITSNSGNQMVFRYADALLLYAEALAALGSDDIKANELLNRIRRRAGAEELMLSGRDLENAIFWERQRELIGEGHYYYDLVRTGKISNDAYCENPIRITAFNAGAWMWPLHRDALINNTHIQLNLYWE